MKIKGTGRAAPKSNAIAMDGDLFSQGTIEMLRKEFGPIKAMDGKDPNFRNLNGLLDRMTQDQLQQLKDAAIPHVSELAGRRIH